MVATAVDLTYLSVGEATTLFRTRALSPVDLTLAHLERIESLQPSLRAFLTITPEIALSEARAAGPCCGATIAPCLVFQSPTKTST